jgi:WhiB family redox-sensing transcriptional regulator
MILVKAEWMQEANCRGMPADFFHPPAGHSRRISTQIRAVCAECPVIEPCRQMAVDDWTLQGYWGGLSARDRLQVRNRMRMVS